MARSLLEQLTQIRRSRTYDDAVSGVNTSAIAEPTVSGSLQDDLNVIRTLMKDMKGTGYWYGDLGSYFDPTSTTSGNAATKALNLSNISGNTLDAKTVIIAVSDDNTGSNYTVSGTSTGFLLSTTAQYATATDRTGLPIFNSVANAGSYWDEGGSQNVCRVDIIDVATDAEMEDGSGNIIYGMFHDGSDFSGSGDGTDAYVRFYADGSPTTLSGVTPTPSAVKVIYPRRKVMSDVAEYEWLRTDFVNSWEGDVELIEDIANLWSFTGAADNVTDPTWTNASANYILASDPTDLESAIDLLNTEVGDRTYTSATYLTDGEDITASLDALSEAIIANDNDISSNAAAIASNSSAISTLNSSMTTAQGDISDLESAVGTTGDASTLNYSSNNFVTDGTSLEAAIGDLDAAISASAASKYIETTSADITAGVEHALPSAAITAGGYTPVSTAGSEGYDMDVYVNGQLLAADTGAAGVNADRDYGETTTSGVTFRFPIPSGTNLIYVIRQ